MTQSQMIRDLYDDTVDEMQRMQDEYGIGPLEQRLIDKAKKILFAETILESDALAGKAKASTSRHCIGSGTKKTAEWFEKQAKSCESRAKSHTRKGEHEKAEKQMEYKAKYERQAAELRAKSQ